MLTPEIREFLAQPLIARLATIDSEGYPHVVPIWYNVDGDDIVFITDRDNAKTRNAIARPQGAVTIGGDIGDSAGYMFRGRLTVLTDEGHAHTHRMIDRYEKPDRAAKLKHDWANDDIVVIRLTPVKVTKVH